MVHSRNGTIRPLGLRCVAVSSNQFTPCAPGLEWESTVCVLFTATSAHCPDTTVAVCTFTDMLTPYITCVPSSGHSPIALIQLSPPWFRCGVSSLDPAVHCSQLEPRGSSWNQLRSASNDERLLCDVDGYALYKLFLEAVRSMKGYKPTGAGDSQILRRKCRSLR